MSLTLFLLYTPTLACPSRVAHSPRGPFVSPVSPSPSPLSLRLQSLLSSADDEQVRMMEEQVILTDYYDRPIGAGSKKDSEYR